MTRPRAIASDNCPFEKYGLEISSSSSLSSSLIFRGVRGRGRERGRGGFVKPDVRTSSKNILPAFALGAALLLAVAGPLNLLAEETAGEKNAAPPAHPPGEEKSGKPVEGAFEQPTGAEMTAARAALLNGQLELARSFRLNSLAPQAEPVLVELLVDENPEGVRQAALLELALCARTGTTCRAPSRSTRSSSAAGRATRARRKSCCGRGRSSGRWA